MNSTPDHASRLHEIYYAILRHQGPDPHPRLMKIGEEFGEVVSAYIGEQGLNKRKGNSHTPEDVANELCDVIITAFVALFDYVPYPVSYFDAALERVCHRVREVGS